MENYTRTDLAYESMQAAGTSFDFADICKEEKKDGFDITRLCVSEDAHSTLLGKPMGNYVTVVCGEMHFLDNGETQKLANVLAEEIRTMCHSLCGRLPDREFSVLVAGLGNEDITADAIGPRAVRKITATRHLRRLDRKLFDIVEKCEVSALFTGVLGQTGIETVELVRGAVENVHPNLVLAIDALAARGVERLATTVQLCDSGISPGSGVGNARKAIDRQTVGVPVISIGVPTVVESSALVFDALSRAGIEEVSEPLRDVLENGRRFFVAPKESDIITERVSALIAMAVDKAFDVGEK